MRSKIIPALLSIALAACGGGSSPGSMEPTPSPGGHWSTVHQGSQVNFYIAETGIVRAVIETDPATIPIVGAGTVSSTATGSVSGSLQASGDQPIGNELGCALSGALEERMSLELVVSCSDDTGIVYDETLSMTPQPGYEVDSSLADIAGNYTLSISAAPNSLNIAADGTVFGMWDTVGQQCTVNGLVSVIDSDHNFLGIEWQFSNCSGPVLHFEEAELTGLAIQRTSSSWPAGTYSFILTGMSDKGFTVVVVTYVPT
jgi:hypothetical protein